MTANKNDNELHFDFAIGNPPYHYETGRRKIPIYQYFMESFGNADISGHACFVTPDGFVKGGQQLEKVRRSFLESNKHLKYVEFHKEPIFAGFAVDAAITYFDNENEYDEIAKKIYQEDGSVVEGTLDWSKRDVIVDDSKEEVRAIYEKGIAYYKDNNPEGITMDSVVPPWAPFGLNTKCYRTNEEKFQKEPTGKYQTKILVDEGDCDFYYIDPEDDFSYEGSDGRIEFVKLENSEKYKVVFPKAGTVRDKPLTTRILLPGEIFTDKFLCILCDTQEEALNAEKYFNSTFYRAGLDSKMTSWNLYRKWHSNLPLPDFHTGQEIDWKASPDVYNKQLAALLGFSEDEWKKIDNYIK